MSSVRRCQLLGFYRSYGCCFKRGRGRGVFPIICWTEILKNPEPFESVRLQWDHISKNRSEMPKSRRKKERKNLNEYLEESWRIMQASGVTIWFISFKKIKRKWMWNPETLNKNCGSNPSLFNGANNKEWTTYSTRCLKNQEENLEEWQVSRSWADKMNAKQLLCVANIKCAYVAERTPYCGWHIFF